QVMKTSLSSDAMIQRKCAVDREDAIQMKGFDTMSSLIPKKESSLQTSSGTGQKLDISAQNMMEDRMGADFSEVKVHTDSNAVEMNRQLGAKAFTHGAHIYFNQGEYNPGSQEGKHLLAHELTHVVQQRSLGKRIQRKEDWDFTPADYKKLKAKKRKLRFKKDSAWVPKKLKKNIVKTIKFVLKSKKPKRTTGINKRDFYHGHLVVPYIGKHRKYKDYDKYKKKREKLNQKKLNFNKKSEAMIGVALGGKHTNKVTSKNLKSFSKTMTKVEKMAKPIARKALKLKGAAVIYHTFEHNTPSGMNLGSSIRNIRTPIGGNPSGYSGPDKNDASSYVDDDYLHILEFTFLVDEKGVIHVSVGGINSLSRITNTPINK
ncbi:MAG: DUF4157 domain-containing protein, partial [Bacteroidota bacterium]